MELEEIEKKFPEYFKNFEMPAEAREQRIEVYRACPTRKLERESFLNTYEENGFRVAADADRDDPQEYCMSTYTKLKDVRRFVVIDSRFQPPMKLAKGYTTGNCGKSCRTREWKKTKSSHVDYWLYEDAMPWTNFELIEYGDEDERISKGK